MLELATGLRHVCFDLSRACTSLSRFLLTIQRESVKRFQKTLRVVQNPKTSMVGSLLIEVACLSDADGTILELCRLVKIDNNGFDAQW